MRPDLYATPVSSLAGVVCGGGLGGAGAVVKFRVDDCAPTIPQQSLA